MLMLKHGKFVFKELVCAVIMPFSYDWQTKALFVCLVFLPQYLSPALFRVSHPSSQQQTELYANTKSHNALYCLVVTFEYLNGAF